MKAFIATVAFVLGAGCGNGRNAPGDASVGDGAHADTGVDVDATIAIDARADAPSSPDAAIDAAPGPFVAEPSDPASTVTCGNVLGFPGVPTIKTNLQAPRFALGDLTGDGTRDIVVTTLNEMQVVAGHGDGTFAAPTKLTSSAVALRTADMNGDGARDLLFLWTANTQSVSIQLNQGNGTFAPLASYDMGVIVGDFHVADIDGDGKRDLVALKTFSDPPAVSVRLNTGATYAAAVITPGLTGARTWAIGDLDGNGKPDIVVANINSTISVLLGAGDGTFATPVSYPTQGFGASLAIADVNGDGKNDVVVASSSGSPVQSYLGVFANAGSGGALAARVDYPAGVGGAPRALALGDTNADGVLDAVVSIRSNQVEVPSTAWIPGAANGSFGTPVILGYRGDTDVVELADLNGDGRADLTAASLGFVTTYLTRASTGIPEMRSVYGYPTTTGSGVNPVELVRLDGDARFDLVVLDIVSSTVWTRFGTATGLTAVPIATSLSHLARSMITADVNADGRVDLVTLSNAAASAVLNNGDGTLTEMAQFAIPPNGGWRAIAGDTNNDGAAEVFLFNDTTILSFRANGGGTYAPATTAMTSTSIRDVAIGDVDGDGYRDLVVSYYEPPTNVVGVLRGTGYGTFRAPIKTLIEMQAPITLRDFNHDGNLDLQGPGVVVFGDGTGHWTGGGQAGNGWRTDVATADVNGDGNLDLIETTTLDFHMTVTLGNANGTFAAPLRYEAGLSLRSLAVGDIDGDGRVDIAINLGANATVLYGRCIP